jgi:hypothetical protein
MTRTKEEAKKPCPVEKKVKESWRWKLRSGLSTQ